MIDIAQTLQWYDQMGVDEITSNTPFKPVETAKAKKLEKAQNDNNNVSNKIDTKASQSPSLLLSQSRELAQSCTSLEQLKKAVMEFKGLAITKTATNTVFADGNPNAKIMLIGEAPGAEEDAQGIPFCGPSGKLLDQMLSCIDLSRQENFYISNTVFWRPPGNRRPTPEELAICSPFVEKHIQLINPDLIVLVGGTAVSAVIDKSQGITKIRGNFYDYSNSFLSAPIKTTAIFHPSYLLRSPGQKKLAWQDLLMIEEHLNDKNANS